MPGMQCCCGSDAGASTESPDAVSLLVPAYIWPDPSVYAQLVRCCDCHNVWLRVLASCAHAFPAIHRAAAGTVQAEAGSAAIVIITGAISGPPEPGHPRTDLYRQTFGQLAGTGVRLIGYVHTRYGQRPLQEVLDAVQQWYGGYGECLSGVFVDEASCKVGIAGGTCRCGNAHFLAWRGI